MHHNSCQCTPGSEIDRSLRLDYLFILLSICKENKIHFFIKIWCVMQQKIFGISQHLETLPMKSSKIAPKDLYFSIHFRKSTLTVNIALTFTMTPLM